MQRERGQREMAHRAYSMENNQNVTFSRVTPGPLASRSPRYCNLCSPGRPPGLIPSLVSLAGTVQAAVPPRQRSPRDSPNRHYSVARLLRLQTFSPQELTCPRPSITTKPPTSRVSLKFRCSTRRMKSAFYRTAPTADCAGATWRTSKLWCPWEKPTKISWSSSSKCRHGREYLRRLTVYGQTPLVSPDPERCVRSPVGGRGRLSFPRRVRARRGCCRRGRCRPASTSSACIRSQQRFRPERVRWLCGRVQEARPRGEFTCPFGRRIS